MEYSLKINTPERDKAVERFNKLLDQEANIELRKIQPKRTLSQNAWIHLLITLYAIEAGLTIEESKTYLKNQCHFMNYKKQVGEDSVEVLFLRPTSSLDVQECSEFIEWVYDYAGTNGISLPTKEDYIKNKAWFQKLLRTHKRYL